MEDWSPVLEDLSVRQGAGLRGKVHLNLTPLQGLLLHEETLPGPCKPPRSSLPLALAASTQSAPTRSSVVSVALADVSSAAWKGGHVRDGGCRLPELSP